MRVKKKNLYYGMLPSKKDKKKLMADQGISMDGNPPDPRIRNMVKHLPENYFDIFGDPTRQPLGPINTKGTYNSIGSQFPRAPEYIQAPINKPYVQPQRPNPAAGNAMLLGMATIDAALGRSRERERIHNQQVERSQEGYQPYPRGSGSQALMDDGGYMMSPDRYNPIVIPEGVADNTPSAARGAGIPIGRNLYYEELPEANYGYRVKNDVVHMKELPTQKQMENHMEKAKSGNWIQKAVNPKHRGFCTPMSKSTCTPRRKALAKTFKKHHGFHKKDLGGPITMEELMTYGGIIPDNMSNFSPQEYQDGGYIYNAGGYMYDNGGTARGGSDTPDMLENVAWHPSSQDMLMYALGGMVGMAGNMHGKGGPVWNENDDTKRKKKKHHYEDGGCVGCKKRGGSDTFDLLEQVAFHPDVSDMKGWDNAASGKSLSKAKAREMLHDKTAHGHPLTDRQRRYFGAVASGYADAGLPVGPGGLPDPRLTNARPVDTAKITDNRDSHLIDDVNQILTHPGAHKLSAQYSPEENQLVTDAYIWSQRPEMKGKAPQDIISSYFGRPETGTLGAIRQRLSKFGGGPQARYFDTPSIGVANKPIMADGGMMYADGGNVETMWGGNVEKISTNPNDGGTMQFNGQSHENGGIGMHYNGNPVEVEGGETASRDSQGNLNIYGNMYLPGTKTKFKTVAKEIADKEKRYDYLRARGSELVNNSNPANKFEKLAFNAGKAMMAGGTIGQKDLAEKKENLAHLQRAMLDTADEYGIDAQEMSAGNIKKAKSNKKAKGGAYIPFAETGLDIDSGPGDPNDPTRADRNKNPGNIKYGKWAKDHGATGQDKDGFAIFADKNTGLSAMKGLLKSKDYGNLSVAEAISKWTGGKPYRYSLGDIANKKVSDLSGDEFNSAITAMVKGEGTRYGAPTRVTPRTPITPTTPPVNIPRYNLPNVPLTPDIQRPNPDRVTAPPLGNINVPERRPLPSNAEPLGLGEVSGELFAAATNRVEPVAMQHYRPDLYQPYQISEQDRLNQNQSTFNALQRTLGATNPNALGAIASQKYAADNSVKADEFRTNQAISNDITNRNIALNNDAKLKNLQLADTQYTRQSEAKSKTQELNQLIVNSLSSKYAQNKLENKRLKLYENLYDYRFMPTDQGGLQATYLGPNATFNFNQNPMVRQNNQDARTVSTYDSQGNLKNYKTYNDSQLKEAKDAMELEMQRRKLPLLTVPPLE